MRRSSHTPLQTQTSEPLIVIEETGVTDNEGSESRHSSQNNSSDDESPTNPYLLSPWRDSRETRKHSLPTPQCSGITASQVRRLSERGNEAAGVREAAFLATLSAAPPVPGGRRHSVVTISKVPSVLFGRNRRESVAAFPTDEFSNRVLPSRRESFAGPPSTEPRGNIHNLQLDIMDDIVRARKVRMKMWNTSSERVCEVESLDEAGGAQRYTNSSGRRYSDFVGTTLSPIPSTTGKRRASELPPPATTSSTTSKQSCAGIICSNTDLISILSSLSSSATEINQIENRCEKDDNSAGSNSGQMRSRLRSNRSNSFDVSILKETDNNTLNQDNKSACLGPSNWFLKRHQPTNLKSFKAENKILVPCVTVSKDSKKTAKEPNKVMWDERSGSLVDAELLGCAIEGFLKRSGPEGPDSSVVSSASVSPNKAKSTSKSKSGWFANKGDESDSLETCDSSLCSTLKDLFVK